jgi:translation initiation factor 2B subunit (eIF-2B alpha/beta/delta family)
MSEGQSLATELGWAGLQVTLGIDMALFGWLPEVDALVIGADSLSISGLVNKTGTTALMRVAADLDIPRILLCTSSKFLPRNASLERGMCEGDPGEIMPTSSQNITIRNCYFEIAPLDLVSTLITEKGPLDHAQLAEALGRIRAYPKLLGIKAVR